MPDEDDAPSCLATKCPPWAMGPTSTTSSVGGCALVSGALGLGGYCCGKSLSILQCLCFFGGLQLPRNTGNHDSGFEMEPCLYSECCLVVDELFPPFTHHIFGDIHHDEVTRGGVAAHVLDVVHDGGGYGFAVRAGQYGQGGTGISSFSQSRTVCSVSSVLMSTVTASRRDGRDARA